MKTLLFVTLLLAFVNLNVCAQVKTNFNNPEQIGSRGKYAKNFQGKSPFVIPARNIKALIDKETMGNADGMPKPFRIAEAVPVNIDVAGEAEWVEEDGIAYGMFSIVAAGAKSISANFDKFYLPAGAELYVYSENGEMITGPITETENNENNFWGSWVYKGGKLTVDFKTPIENKSLLKLQIASIAYGYKDLYVTNFGESEACNVNVLCAAGNGWENERNSVALILDANSEALCSGALINNTCNLNIPYLLTANHCFDTPIQQNVAQWKFTYQAWSATCTPSQNANGVTFNGSTLRARNVGSDFCLVELNQLPPANSGITFSGWSRANIASPSGVSITHPMGDVMKIAIYNAIITQQTFLESNDWRVVWANGTVEPGSSGGPLYDNNHRIIGQVHGGNPSDICTANDHAFFGRFDLSWTGGGTNATRLSNWLDPSNTGAMTINTRGINPITGVSTLCTTTTTFTFPNQPPGSTVTWSSSNPSGLTIDPTSGVATRQNNFVGLITITANVNGGLCAPVNNTRLVAVGSPAPSVNYIEVPVPNKPSRYEYTATSIPEATYEWYVNNALQSGYTGNTFFTYIPCGITKSVKCRINNSCGTSAFSNSISITGECLLLAASSTMVYPNPVSSELIVNLTNDKEDEPDLSSTEIVLISSYQEKVYVTKATTMTIKIPVDKLPDGVYYLHIINKEGTIQKRVLITHK